MGALSQVTELVYADVDDTLTFLRALYDEDAPGHLVLWTGTPRWNRAADLETVARVAVSLVATKNVYFGVALQDREKAVRLNEARSPKQRARNPRGESASAIAIPGFWLDLDLSDGGRTKAKKNYPTTEQAQALLDALPLLPTLVVDSGAGWHVYWLFRELMFLEEGEDRKQAEALCMGWQDYVREKLGEIAPGTTLDSTGDLARILRLPGTLNHNHGEPCPVKVLRSGGPRHELSAFKEILEDVIAFRTVVDGKRADGPGQSAVEVARDAKPPEDKFKLLMKDEKFQRTWNRDRPDLKDQSASAYDLSLASQAARAEWIDKEIACLLVAWRRKHGEDICKIADRSDYLRRTLAKAREGIGNGCDRAVFPQIIVSNRQLRDISNQACSCLRAKNDPPVVFERCGKLVRIYKDEKKAHSIQELSESALRGRLAEVAGWIKGEKKEKSKNVYPPPDVVKDILHNGAWASSITRFPPLSGLTECPTLRPDGSVLDQPGYDMPTAIYYVTSLSSPPTVPRAPSGEDVQRALSLITETIADFPFVDESSCANVIGLLLTPVVRLTINGCVPLALIDSPQAGTGKTLLADVISLIATGRGAAVMPVPSKDEELEKRITAILASGAPLVVFDNLEPTLDFASLCSALTADVYQGRILGRSEIVSVPQRAVWIATGNNMRVGGDIPRRCFWIRLDAKQSRAWQRTEFKHPRLFEWVRDRRTDIVTALLILARAWVVAGRPSAEVPHLGRFEDWTGIVGGILAYAGVEGFLGNLEVFYERADEESAEWEEFLRFWAELYEAKPVSVSTLAEAINGCSPLFAVVPAAIAEAKGLPGDFNRKMGKALSRKEGVRYGDDGIHLERGGERRRAVLWRVVKDRDGG